MSTDLFSVSSNVSTYHALKNIEANEYGTVIVTNDQKVVGTLSDGDIIVVNPNSFQKISKSLGVVTEPLSKLITAYTFLKIID